MKQRLEIPFKVPGALVCLYAFLVLVTLGSCSPVVDEAVKPELTIASWHKDVTEAIHVSFVPGQTALAAEGTLEEGATAGYIVSAHQGDYLIAHVLSPGADLEVSVHRLDDGSKLSDTDQNPSYWADIVPETLGYLVKVRAVESGPFALEVEIPRRIILDADSNGAEITTLAPTHTPVTYVLEAEAGQLLTASVSALEDGDAQFAIHGLQDGHQLVQWEASAASFEGEVPKTQDYLIRVLAVGAPTELVLKVNLGS